MATPLLTQPAIGATLETIASALEHPGYAILDDALPTALPGDLLGHFKSMADEKFHRAGIGKEADFQVNRFVRSDEIHWLDGSHPVTRTYFKWIEQVRNGLNQRLFLGLFDYECHYAFYPPGAFYRKHYDSFRGSSSRIVSTVLYLNPSWTPGDGGELLIYDPGSGSVIETVEPMFGRMVLFLSEEFPHEVLPANRSRYSLTGWFRVNNSIGDNIDPAR